MELVAVAILLPVAAVVVVRALIGSRGGDGGETRFSVGFGRSEGDGGGSGGDGGGD